MSTPEESQFHRSFVTQERAQLIDLFSGLAECVDPEFLANPLDIPRILVTGGHRDGKSLAVEAIMKSWSDDHDPADMLSGEMNRMFLEKRPGEAVNCLSETFNVANNNVLMAFCSSANNKQELEEPANRIQEDENLQGGALFLSDQALPPSGDTDIAGAKPWLGIYMGHAAQLGNCWSRVSTIRVMNRKLLEDRRFAQSWDDLCRTYGQPG